VIIVKDGIENFYRERFGSLSNIFRRHFNKGKIGPARGRQTPHRKEIVGWEVKKHRKP
jgi:hypothetical protein